MQSMADTAKPPHCSNFTKIVTTPITTKNTVTAFAIVCILLGGRSLTIVTATLTRDDLFQCQAMIKEHEGWEA